MLKKDSKFMEHEKELNRLYALKERSNAENYQIIVFCRMNLTFLEEYPLDNCDEEAQLDLITLRGDYYLSLFKALSAIKNPTENDISDQLKYRELAYEYQPDEVKKIELESNLNDDRLQLDHDLSLALHLDELENNGNQVQELQQKEYSLEELEQKEKHLRESEHKEQNIEKPEQTDPPIDEFVFIDDYEPQEKTTNSKNVFPFMKEEIKKQYHNSLFAWAKNLQPEILERYINKILDKKYTPLLATFSFRQRTEPVKEYLKTSKHESGDNRLAYILSSGTQDDGALNTLLVAGLTPIMLRKYPIPHIELAIQNKNFEKAILDVTRDVVFFAKKDQRFTHSYSDAALSLVYRTIYDWVDTLTERSFQSLINSSLSQSGLAPGRFWRAAKLSGLEENIEENYKANRLAMIFIKESSHSTLSECLFVKIVKAIKKEVTSGKFPSMSEDPNYKLVANFNLEEHKDFYLDNLRTHRETIATAAKQPDSVIMSNVY